MRFEGRFADDSLFVNVETCIDQQKAANLGKTWGGMTRSTKQVNHSFYLLSSELLDERFHGFERFKKVNLTT